MIRLSLASLSFLVCSLVATATTLYDVRFDSSSTTFTGPAKLGSTGDQWNFLTFSGVTTPQSGGISSLKSTAGISSGIAVNWSTVYRVGNRADTLFLGTPYETLMAGYMYTQTADPATITLTGLTANSLYTFVVYSAVNRTGRTSNFTFTGGLGNTVTKSIVASNTGLDFSIEGTNFATFYVRSSSAGTLTLTMLGVGPAEADINGFQFYQGTPEPASYATALLGLALLGGLARFRRRTE